MGQNSSKGSMLNLSLDHVKVFVQGLLMLDRCFGGYRKPSRFQCRTEHFKAYIMAGIEIERW